MVLIGHDQKAKELGNNKKYNISFIWIHFMNHNDWLKIFNWKNFRRSMDLGWILNIGPLTPFPTTNSLDCYTRVKQQYKADTSGKNKTLRLGGIGAFKTNKQCNLRLGLVAVTIQNAQWRIAIQIFSTSHARKKILSLFWNLQKAYFR